MADQRQQLDRVTFHQVNAGREIIALGCASIDDQKFLVIELIEDGCSIEILDLDEQQDIAVKYRISSVPTMIIEENGIEVDRFIGALPKKQVIQKLID